MQATLRSCSFSLWYTYVWMSAATRFLSTAVKFLFQFALVVSFRICFQHVCRTLETGWLNINIAVDFDAIWLVARYVNILYRFSVIWYSFIVLALVFVWKWWRQPRWKQMLRFRKEQTWTHTYACVPTRVKNKSLSRTYTLNGFMIWFHAISWRVFMLNLAAKSIRMKSKAK